MSLKCKVEAEEERKKRDLLPSLTIDKGPVTFQSSTEIAEILT